MSVSTAIDPDALKYMLAIPRGRAVLWDILAAGGLFRTPFSENQRQSDFNMGSHNLALIIYADCMSASPELTALMIREQGDYDNAAGTEQPAPGRPEQPVSEPGDEDSPGLGFDRGFVPVQ